MSSRSYKDNDVVWVKYGGFPWWPSVVFPLHMATAEHKKQRPTDKRAILVRFFDPDRTVGWPTPRDLRPWNCKMAGKFKKNKKVQSSVRAAEAFIKDGRKVGDEYEEAVGLSYSSSDDDDDDDDSEEDSDDGDQNDGPSVFSIDDDDDDDDDSEEDSDDGDQNDVNKEQDHKQTEGNEDDNGDDDNSADENEDEEIEDSSMTKTSEVKWYMDQKLVKGHKKINRKKKESEQATELVAASREQDRQEEGSIDDDVDSDEGRARKRRRLKSISELRAEDDDEEDDVVQDDTRQREEVNEQDCDYDDDEDDDDDFHGKPKKKPKKKKKKREKNIDNHEGGKYDNDENWGKRRPQSTDPATNSTSSSDEKSKKLVKGDKKINKKRKGSEQATELVAASREEDGQQRNDNHSKKEIVHRLESMPQNSGKKRAEISTVGESLAARPSKKAKLGSDEDSLGQENVGEYKKFEPFLKKARLSEYVEILRKDGYAYEYELAEMESHEIEKYFQKKPPHRRRFEKAIKEMKKTTSVKPSKKPKPVIDHKFALIIGNGDYKYSPLGSNPINDAQLVRNKFEYEYGYKVFYHENLNSKDMKDALTEFEEALKNAGGESLAVVFFAGHGVLTTNANGLSVNLLLGIDNVGYEDERGLQRKQLNTNEVIEALEEAKVSMKILLLDCCREVPGMPLSVVYKKRSLAKRGLRIPREEVEGCMILYACQPGKVSLNGEKKNGLFTESLMEVFKSKKNERNPPTFYDLVSEAGKIMKHHNQQPAVEIPCVGQSVYMCIDGTHFKDWYTLP